MPSRPESITAVLPAYNEAAVIEDVVTRAHAALAGAQLQRYEVLVVDDGSADGTGRIVESLGASLPQVRVVRHDVNRGYGAALRTGFEGATGEHVWLLDSDGQFDPADLRHLLAVWQPGVFVAGYRIARRDSVLRRLYHSAFFALVGLVFGPTVRDVNCAFKLFPRPCGVGLTCEGAVISTELVLRARAAGLRIVEVGIEHHPRVAGSATGARPGVVIRAFGELVALRRRLRAQERGRSGAAVPPVPEPDEPGG